MIEVIATDASAFERDLQREVCGEVHFEPVAGERSRLKIEAADPEPLGIDAVVQRFRERLKRKGLL